MTKNKGLLKLFSAVAICTALTACNKSSDSATAANEPVQPSEVVRDQAPSGNAVATSNVTDHQLAAGETPSGSDPMSLEEILAAFPTLASHAEFLGSIDKVVETDAGTLDLYSGGAIVMTLAWDAASSSYTVRSSTVGYAADSITREMADGSEQDQNSVMESIRFVSSDCRAEEPSQDQDQDQGKAGKEEDQDKDQDQDQDQGKAPAEEPKEPKEEIKQCAAIEMVLTLEKIKEDKEQDQDKDQDQDQGKTGKDEDQDQGKDEGQTKP